MEINKLNRIDHSSPVAQDCGEFRPYNRFLSFVISIHLIILFSRQWTFAQFGNPKSIVTHKCDGFSITRDSTSVGELLRINVELDANERDLKALADTTKSIGTMVIWEHKDIA